MGSEFWETLADRAQLPGEPMPGVPLVEIAGESRVLIEHHRGVTRYDRQTICVRVCYGEIAVRGQNLQLRQMTREQLLICGSIESVSLEKRGKP